MTPTRLTQLRAHAQRGHHFTNAMALEVLDEVERRQRERETMNTETETLRRLLNESERQNTNLRAMKDGAYAERNQCVALLVRMALALGWPAGVGKHQDKPGETWEDDWRTVVHIQLPTGQVSWHFHDSERHLLAGLPDAPFVWDGHDTPEKYRRVNAALKETPCK